MKRNNDRYLKFSADGSTRHIKTGDKFILDNLRRTTFVYSLFECPAIGTHFITPSTIRKQFSHKLKVWFPNFNILPKNNEGFYEKINDRQDIITRQLLGSNYTIIQKYDIKSIDETFMVFDSKNDYQFKGVFKPKEWQTTEDYFYIQEFIKIADEIKFTPTHKQHYIQVDEDLLKDIEEIFANCTESD